MNVRCGLKCFRIVGGGPFGGRVGEGAVEALRRAADGAVGLAQRQPQTGAPRTQDSGLAHQFAIHQSGGAQAMPHHHLQYFGRRQNLHQHQHGLGFGLGR